MQLFNQHRKSVLLLSFAIQLVLLSISGTEGDVLRSPQVTNWGDWGFWDECPGDGIVTALNVKVEHDDNKLGDDDTALNGIALRCNDPRDPYRLVTWIKSSVGSWGKWGSTRSCPYGSYAYGFKLKSEKPGGDDTGANNIRLFCRWPSSTYADTIEGNGREWGDWTEEQSCREHYGICGIKTQVEKPQADGDDTALNNVNMKCCPVSRP